MIDFIQNILIGFLLGYVIVPDLVELWKLWRNRK